ncbi:hypothetical protein BG005_007408 [Podila minutissima]|nr:hypothetical protein BG005_007408 [Podila minutissima]
MLDLRNSTHALLSDAASQPQAQLDVEQAKKALKTMREVDEEVKKEKAILVFRQKKLEEEDEDSDVAYARKEAAVANWVKSQRMYKGRKPAMARGDPNSNRMKKKMKKKEKKAKKSQDADPSSNKDNVSDMPSISQGSVHQEPGDHHQDGDEKDDEEEENQGRTHRRSRTHESTQVHSFQNV